ncbi:MAG: nucleoside triphosphate pyrophosphohydrolase [Bacteroidales bacterium]|jgi:XTP/dITP diphosphohydrolase|nr:nucleoside triphosphate pyrophosphohydrolase [Bacteroidales bacterium]
MKRELAAFEKLLQIMDKLRAGCPWDKKQTWESLRYLTIEETHELSDAILAHDAAEVSKELGDLIMHIIFYAKIASEKDYFTIADVLEKINEKLRVRHPHIFGDVKVTDAKDVRDNWERIKIEKEGKKSLLEGVPKSLPSLVKAYRMQEKAAGIGFDWHSSEEVWDKVKEEYLEFLEAVQEKDNQEHAEEEFGDLLFALVNYARWKDINPEDALEKANRKFIFRFQYIENRAKEAGKMLHEMSLEEMEALWQEAKKHE